MPNMQRDYSDWMKRKKKGSFVKVGSDADDKWCVEVYDNETHYWIELTNPTTYEESIKRMKGYLGTGFSQPEKNHHLRVRRIGTDDFVLNDLLT